MIYSTAIKNETVFQGVTKKELEKKSFRIVSFEGATNYHYECSSLETILEDVERRYLYLKFFMVVVETCEEAVYLYKVLRHPPISIVFFDKDEMEKFAGSIIQEKSKDTYIRFLDWFDRELENYIYPHIKVTIGENKYVWKGNICSCSWNPNSFIQFLKKQKRPIKEFSVLGRGVFRVYKRLDREDGKVIWEDGTHRYNNCIKSIYVIRDIIAADFA